MVIAVDEVIVTVAVEVEAGAVAEGMLVAQGYAEEVADHGARLL